MKKLFSTISITVCLSTGIYSTANAMSMDVSSTSSGADSSGIQIYVDGHLMSANGMMSYDSSGDQIPMVPIRCVSEALGAKVTWDGDHQAVLVNTNSYPVNAPSANGISVIVDGHVLKPSSPPFGKSK